MCFSFIRANNWIFLDFIVRDGFHPEGSSELRGVSHFQGDILAAMAFQSRCWTFEELTRRRNILTTHPVYYCCHATIVGVIYHRTTYKWLFPSFNKPLAMGHYKPIHQTSDNLWKQLLWLFECGLFSWTSILIHFNSYALNCLSYRHCDMEEQLLNQIFCLQ